MKIGLIDVDSKLPNLALMKLKRYYPNAELTGSLLSKKYDRIYASAIFDYSNKSHVPKVAVRGGTGFDIRSKLLPEIESCQPDYSLYPDCNFSYQRFTVGCVRKCPFCVAWKMTKFQDIDRMNLNQKGKWIYLLDNNFFASENWKENIKYLINLKQPVQFEGIDIRLMNSEMMHYLLKIKVKNQTYHTAWDNPREKVDLKIIELIPESKRRKFMFYVLIGYWSTKKEDLYRVMKLDELNVLPFVMPFDKFNTYQKRFANWVNKKSVFYSTKWEDFK